MSIEEQPAAPAATESRSAARQREPAVDEDDLPLDDLTRLEDDQLYAAG